MRQLIIARKDLNMSPGKLAAQCCHASIAFLTSVLRDREFVQACGYYDVADEWVTTDYEATLILDPKVYEDWICGIFTKTICEAKNKNQLLKAVTGAKRKRRLLLD